MKRLLEGEEKRMLKEKVAKFTKQFWESWSQALKIKCYNTISDENWKFVFESSVEEDGAWCQIDTTNRIIKIHVGTPAYMFDDCPYRQKYINVLGKEPDESTLAGSIIHLSIHEYGHALATRVGNTTEIAANGFKMRKPQGASPYALNLYLKDVTAFFQFLLNCFEDGRIENLIRNAMPRMGTYLDFGRILDHGVADTPSKSQLWNFGYYILQMAVIGRPPQYPIDPKAIEAFESICTVPVAGSKRTRNLFDEYLCEPNPKKANELFLMMLDVPKFHDYLAELIFDEIETSSKERDELRKMLNSMPQEVTITGKSRNPMGIGMKFDGKVSVKNAGGEKSDDEKDAESGGGSGDQDKKQDEGDKKDGNGGSGKSDDEKDEQKDGSGNGDKDSDKDGKDSAKDDKNSNNGSASNEGNDSKNNQSSSKDGNASNSQQSSKDMTPSTDDHDTFDKDGKWSLSDTDDSGNNGPSLKEDAELRKAFDAAIETIAAAAKSFSKPIEKPSNGTQSRVRDTKIQDKIVEEKVVATMVAPPNVKKAARPLRSMLEMAFANNNDSDIRYRKSGNLDTRNMYRYKLNDIAIFKKESIPEATDAAWVFCWDNSGSMCGHKQQESAYACAVIEEATKELYAVKIVGFCTQGSVTHYIVKDFDDKSEKNCSYSFGAQRYFNGGNKDGVSIRACVEDLIKRDETNKFLVVLSDGAPSAYPSHEEAVNDVKSAVNYAREKDIEVMSIFFGSQHERDSQIDLYKEMYGKGHIISCEPSEIVSHMINIIKNNIYKR